MQQGGRGAQGAKHLDIDATVADDKLVDGQGSSVRDCP